MNPRSMNPVVGARVRISPGSDRSRELWPEELLHLLGREGEVTGVDDDPVFGVRVVVRIGDQFAWLGADDVVELTPPDAFCTPCGGFRGHRLGCPTTRRSR